MTPEGMMKISLGCRICRKPLEQMEAINKINTRKPLRPHQKPEDSLQEKKAVEPRLEHLDPHPVATKCGHLFHLGCVKKLINEKARCRIDCPTCNKPVVLAQLRGIKFFYPSKCDTMSIKIRRMNQENNTLTKELAEVKKLKAHKKYETEVITAKIEEAKHKADKRAVEFKNKVEELTGMTVDGLCYDEINSDLQDTRQRIMELSGKNSHLLRHLESIVSQLNLVDEDETKDNYYHQTYPTNERQKLNIMTSCHSLIRNYGNDDDEKLNLLPISKSSKEWTSMLHRLNQESQTQDQEMSHKFDDEPSDSYLTSRYQRGDHYHDDLESRSTNKFSMHTESNVSLDKMVMLPPDLLEGYDPPMAESCPLKITREKKRKVKKRLASRGMKKYVRF